MRRLIAALVVLVAGWTPALHAASDAQEFYVRTYKEIGNTGIAGARGRAMGGAQTALLNGPASVQENPAALGAFCDRGVEGEYGVDWLDNGDDHTSRGTFRVGGAMSLNTIRPNDFSNQTIGVAYKYVGSDDPHRIGADRFHDEFKQHAVTFAYGQTLGCDLLVGASASVFDGRWYYENTTVLTDPLSMRREFTGAELKLGGLWRVGDPLTLGATAAYAGGTLRERYDDTIRENGDIDRWTFRVGASWQLSEDTLVSGEFSWLRSKTDLKKTYDTRLTSYSIGAGVEHQILPESLVVRGGVYYARDDAKLDFVDGTHASGKGGYWGMTAGAGARLGRIDVNAGLDFRTCGDFGLQGGAQYEW